MHLVFYLFLRVHWRIGETYWSHCNVYHCFDAKEVVRPLQFLTGRTILLSGLHVSCQCFFYLFESFVSIVCLSMACAVYERTTNNCSSKGSLVHHRKVAKCSTDPGGQNNVSAQAQVYNNRAYQNMFRIQSKKSKAKCRLRTHVFPQIIIQ